ncbi:hypothetical protein [Paramicrobacterium chengjingii]|uniref:hypothetical protein n=1 Tax=Paramicrobacterium chengjingii TaxID=2769067 RepID=UPI00141F20DC|nr:hypothetical protein [Microbacterium chengjingii]
MMAGPSIRLRDVPWLIVLVLVAVFQLIRGAWADAGIFGAALLGVSVLTTMPKQRLPVAKANRRSVQALSIAAVLAGIVLVVAPRHGTVTGLVVCVIGIFAGYSALAGGPHAAMEPRRSLSSIGRARPRALRNALIAWGSLIVLAGVWEATAYLSWKWGLLADGVMPSISDVLDPLLDTWAWKTVFVFVWLAGGTVLMLHALPVHRRNV